MRQPFGPSHGLVLALALAFAAPVAAQSLGEVAARNKEKEKKGNAKVYTEADLHGGKGGTVSQPGDPAAAAAAVPVAGEKKADGTAPPAAEGEKPKTEEELKAEAVKAWQERKAKTEADIARLNADVTKIQAALGDLSGPLYGGSRTALLNRMDETKKQLAAAQATLTDITEEGRRAGYR